MDLQALKNSILNKSVSDDLIIFVNKNNNVIIDSYIKEIAKSKDLDISYLSDLSSVIQDDSSIFYTSPIESLSRLNVYKVDQFVYSDTTITGIPNLIIVSQSIDDSTYKLFKPYIIEIPKIEQWHINAYANKLAEGANKKDIDFVLSLCSNNLDRLNCELSKLELFSVAERKFLLEQMIMDGSFNDISDYTIFNFTNALIKKDMQTLKSIYKEIKNVDINEFGLAITLLKNFKNIISVHLNNNPTVANTGLSDKQLYAIKKLPRCFSQESLVNIYKFLCSIDSKIKMGELPIELSIDYITMKVLTL